MITRFTAAAIAAAGLYFNSISPADAASPGFSVLHHERMAGLSLERHATPSGVGQSGSRATRLRFRALGRAFDIDLRPNDRLLANLSSRHENVLKEVELYRGSVAGRADTWARVSVLHGDLYALIWDGSELYAVEPAFRLAGSLVEDEAVTRDPIVFRVSDVQGDFRDDAIAPATAKVRPYDALIGELQTVAVTTGPSRRLDLGLVADAEFTAANPDAEAELLLRANYVDGIFSEQLGLQVNVSETETLSREPDAFSSSDPTTLLESVSTYRAQDPAMRAQALVHLYTGRHLDGDVVGIAYLDGVCDASSGVGLTQAGDSVFHDALITAHEIGHNLGARHDAEAGSPCESTPATYLMAPQLSGNDQFSQCSLAHIASTLEHASCLGPAVTGDVRVTVSAAESALLGDDVPVRVSVDNIGDEASANVVVTFQASIGAQVTSGVSTGHDCGIGDGQVHCAIGTLAAGTSAHIDVQLTGTRTGSVTLLATAEASNDTNALNNAAARSLELTPAVVLVVGMQPETIELGAGDTAPVEIRLYNDSGLNATAVSLELSSSFELTDLVFPGATCARADDATPRYRCDVATLRSHVTQTLHGVIHAPAQVRAGAVIHGVLSATATAAEPLARAGSNTASATVRAYSAVVDLASSITSAAARIQAGTSTHIVVELRNHGPDAAPDARLDVKFPANLTVMGTADDYGACKVSGTAAVRCDVATLGDGESVDVDVEVVASEPGSYSWSASATQGGMDPNSANDSSRQTMEVMAAPGTSHPASSGSSGGGGGGGASWTLLLLAAIGLRRKRLTPPAA